MPKIHSRIRQARLDYQQRIGRDVSVSEVAKAIEISRAALSSIETGRTEPKFETLAKLCRFYGVGIADLLEYDAEGNSVLLGVGLETQYA